MKIIRLASLTPRQVAKQLISIVWRRNPSLSAEEKYSAYQIGLFIDSEEDTNTLLNSLGEDKTEEIMAAIAEELKQREEAVFARRRSKLNPLDPIHHLKQLVRGKTWEAAKKAITATRPSGRPDSDENEAEIGFQILWQAAHGGSYSVPDRLESRSPYVKEDGKRHLKRLNEIYTGPHVPGDNEKNGESLFFRRFFGDGPLPSTIRVYRGVPRADTKIRPGDFVTVDRDYARSYLRGKTGAIVEGVAAPDELVITSLDIDRNEFIYWPKGTSADSPSVTPPMTLRQFWETVNGRVGY